MNRRLISAVLVACLTWGCWGESADQMMRTAEFEEVQRNHPHARELYERIIKEHPGSPEAAKAAERLKALEEQDH